MKKLVLSFALISVLAVSSPVLTNDASACVRGHWDGRGAATGSFLALPSLVTLPLSILALPIILPMNLIFMGVGSRHSH